MSQSIEQFPHFDLSRPTNWRRVDETDDGSFYVQPRLVVHVDDHFIKTLREFLAAKLPPQAAILDLMSSYKSHLPAGYQAAKVVGLGMNAVEMKANNQLTEYVVQNLNQNPQLPFEDASFEVVLNTVSVQYLKQPIAVFKEVGRVLKPGGLHIVSFSNRMFPTKAVQIWRELEEAERVYLVSQYFEESGAFAQAQVFSDLDQRPQSRWQTLFASSDPVYIVFAEKVVSGQ